MSIEVMVEENNNAVTTSNTDYDLVARRMASTEYNPTARRVDRPRPPRPEPEYSPFMRRVDRPRPPKSDTVYDLTPILRRINRPTDPPKPEIGYQDNQLQAVRASLYKPHAN